MKKVEQIKLITILNHIVDNKRVPLLIRDNACNSGYRYWIYDKEEKEYRCVNHFDEFYSFIPHELIFTVDVIYWGDDNENS